MEYTHENSEVVGSSRVEASLSRRALEAGQDLQLGGQHVFADTQERERSLQKSAGRRSGIPDDDNVNANGDASKSVSVDYDDDDDDDDDGLGGGKRRKIEWRYHPPEGVRKRQLCSMAKAYGMDDVVEFALVVEGWKQEERRRWLDRFYRGRREVLGQLGQW